MDLIENIQYNIDKAMMEDGEFYTAVVTYLNGTRDDRSAQTVFVGAKSLQRSWDIFCRA